MMQQVDETGIDPAHTEDDLTRLDPARWAEARLRVAVLRHWCEKPRHRRVEAESAAERLGVSVKHFERLVAVWKKSGDIMQVAGGGANRGAPRGSMRLPAETQKAVLAATAALGPRADFGAVQREAKARCDRLGTPEASAGMVHYLLMRARQFERAGDGAGSTDLIVGRVRVLLPVQTAAGVIADPDLLLAVTENTRVVSSHRLVLDRALGAPASDLLEELEDGEPGKSDKRIIVGRDVSDAIAQAAFASPVRPSVISATGSRVLSKLLGSWLAGLEIRHQGFEKERRSVRAAIDPTDAENAILLAVNAHNRARTS